LVRNSGHTKLRSERNVKVSGSHYKKKGSTITTLNRNGKEPKEAADQRGLLPIVTRDKKQRKGRFVKKY